MNPLSLLGDVFGLAREFIVDKDKLIEFQHKAKELELQLATQLISTKTTPGVDATVKLLYALNSLWRPIVGAAMTLFGAYAHYKGIQMDTAAHLVFDGAFPAWGASRHIEKQKKAKAESWSFDD